MRARVLAMLCAVALLLPATGIAVAADAPPAPPTITPLCVTDKEYLWTVSSDATGLPDYNIDYTTKESDDWSYPNGMTESPLAVTATGEHVATIPTAKADGTHLIVRFTSLPSQISSSTAAPTTACAMATLAVKRVVQGGTATPAEFPVTVARSIVSFVDPALSESIVTPLTSDAPQSVQPGNYSVGPTKEAGAYLPLPAGYVWRSTACAGGAIAGTTTDVRYQRLVNPVAPGSTNVCTITYHYGPVLGDTIAAGKKTTGTIGFKTAPITVAKGTVVTYLVTTSPSLAGQDVQIWTKAKGKAWKLAATRKVGTDGSVRYYAKVSAWTGFLAKWPGDDTYVASQASGRYVIVK
jgi:hypothetical protein